MYASITALDDIFHPPHFLDFTPFIIRNLSFLSSIFTDCIIYFIPFLNVPSVLLLVLCPSFLLFLPSSIFEIYSTFSSFLSTFFTFPLYILSSPLSFVYGVDSLFSSFKLRFPPFDISTCIPFPCVGLSKVFTLYISVPFHITA